METLHISVSINASKEKVWNTMLGPEGYKDWTAEFAEGCYFEGTWEKGKKILFLGPGPDKGGMTAVIAENRPLEFVSIKHLGFVKDGIEDTESPEIKAWAPAFENYTFAEHAGITTVKVDTDLIPGVEEYMQQTWPKALARLKKLCERPSK